MMTSNWTPQHAVRQVHGDARDFLIVPVMPTPNGRLHVGHIAGPFLKCDVLRRHLLQFGYDARMISGSDDYESHVTVKAAETGETSASVARRYHQAIGNDLASLDIQFDDWASPTDPDFQEIHDRYQSRIFQDFQRTGQLDQRREHVPFCQETNRFALGGWLSGGCPQCGEKAGGYFCESCGAHFRPEELIDPKIKRTTAGETATEVPVESRFLRFRDPHRLIAEAERLGVTDSFREALARYFEQNDAVRVTSPGRWGVSWPYGDGDAHQVIFSYGGLFPFALAFGELYRAARDHKANPFERDSEVVTVTAYGFDNAVPFLAAVQGVGLEHPDYKGFDYHLTNHLMQLEGAKFSTSRRHGIWVAELLACTTLSSDSLRLYLARNSPEDRQIDMDIGDLVAFNNNLSDLLNGVFRSLAEVAPTPGNGPSDAAAKRIEDVCSRFAAALHPAGFSLRTAASELESWIGEVDEWMGDPVSAYWWSKTLALVGAPTMPRFSTQLWALLGHSGTPNAEAFAGPTSPHVTSDPGIPRVAEQAIRAAAA